MTNQKRLHITPCTLKAAGAYIAQHHRHHRPPQGGLFAVAVADDQGDLHGVAIIGRPVARMLQDGVTAEVTRVATDGTPNACSALYGAARRAAKALGYQRLITYTLNNESGTSLVASGWKRAGSAGGGSWSREARPRADGPELGIKQRWEAA